MPKKKENLTGEQMAKRLQLMNQVLGGDNE